MKITLVSVLPITGNPYHPECVTRGTSFNGPNNLPQQVYFRWVGSQLRWPHYPTSWYSCPVQTPSPGLWAGPGDLLRNAAKRDITTARRLQRFWLSSCPPSLLPLTCSL